MTITTSRCCIVFSLLADVFWLYYVHAMHVMGIRSNNQQFIANSSKSHARAHTRTHAHTHARARTHTHRDARAHARTHARTHTHTHTHLHTLTHTDTYTHVQLRRTAEEGKTLEEDYKLQRIYYKVSEKCNIYMYTSHCVFVHNKTRDYISVRRVCKHVPVARPYSLGQHFKVEATSIVGAPLHVA